MSAPTALPPAEIGTLPRAPSAPSVAFYQRFAEEFIIDFRAADAYRRAGGTGRAAKQNASEMLARPKVQQLVREAIAARSVRTAFSADQVIQEIGRLAFSRIDEVLDFDGDRITLKDPKTIPTHARAAIHRIKFDKDTGNLTSVEMYPKGPELDKLARHLGLYPDQPGGFIDARQIHITVVREVKAG